MISRRRLLVLLMLLTSTLPLYAQKDCQGSFSGVVLDESGEPLIGANILFPDTIHGTMTDVNGQFTFGHVCDGTYIVRLRYLGYRNQQTTVVVNGDTREKYHMVPQMNQLSEVVVRDHTVAAGTENAQNFVKLSGKQLEETAGKSIGETLKEIPGVNSIQSGPGIFKPVIHGVHSERILMLNYGIRQEGQSWGAEHAPEIDPFIASNIVVIKDASAIKYGGDALGGVIIVNPPDLPTHAGLGGSLNTIAQSNGRSGTMSGMLQGGVRSHDGWGWRLQGTAKRSGDFHAPDYSLTNTGVKELDYSAATGYHKNNYGFDAFFSHFETELGILKGTTIGNLDDLITAMEIEPPQYTSSFSYRIDAPRQHVMHDLFKLNTHIQTAQSVLRLQYGYQNDVRKEYDKRVGVSSNTPVLALQLGTHTIDLERESLKNGNVSTCFGISTLIQNNRKIPPIGRISFIPNFFSLSSGAYGITSINVNAWKIDLGARYDYRFYSVAGYDNNNNLFTADMNFHNFSATAGASYKLTPHQTINLNLSSAWRPPHVSELYSLGKHQSAAAIEYGLLLDDKTNEVHSISDVHFAIEQAVKAVGSYEIQTEEFDVDATAYANYIMNYIYLQPRGITKTVLGTLPYFKYTQTDAIFVGTDFSGTWHISNNFKVLPRFSLLRVTDLRYHDYLPFIPSNNYEMGFRYEKDQAMGMKDLYVECRVKYVEQQHRSPRVITPSQFKEAIDNGTDPLNGEQTNFDFMAAPPGYYLVDASVGCSLRSRKVKYDFRLASENLTNVSYRDYTNRFRYYADDLGRNVVLSMKASF